MPPGAMRGPFGFNVARRLLQETRLHARIMVLIMAMMPSAVIASRPFGNFRPSLASREALNGLGMFCLARH